MDEYNGLVVVGHKHTLHRDALVCSAKRAAGCVRRPIPKVISRALGLSDFYRLNCLDPAVRSRQTSLEKIINEPREVILLCPV